MSNPGMLGWGGWGPDRAGRERDSEVRSELGQEQGSGARLLYWARPASGFRTQLLQRPVSPLLSPPPHPAPGSSVHSCVPMRLNWGPPGQIPPPRIIGVFEVGPDGGTGRGLNTWEREVARGGP